MTRAVDSRALIATDGSEIRMKLGATLPPVDDLGQTYVDGNRTDQPEGTFALPGWQVWGLATVGGTRVLVAYEMQTDGTWAGPFGAAPPVVPPPVRTGILPLWTNGAHAIDDLVLDPVGLGVYRCTAVHTDAATQTRPDLRRFALVGDYAGRRPMAADPRDATTPVAIAATNPGTVFGRVQGAGIISRLQIRVGTSAGSIGLAHHPTMGPATAPVPGIPQYVTNAIPCPPAGDAVVTLNDGTAFPVYHNDWFSLWADDPSATFQGTGGAPYYSDLQRGWSGFDNFAVAQSTAVAPPMYNGHAGGVVIVGLP